MTNRYPILLSAMLLMAGLTTSCTDYLYYQPGTVHMPTLKNKHDGAININLMGASEGIPSYEVNGAYAFGKKYYVAGQHSIWNAQSFGFSTSSFNSNTQYRYSELGLGMYFPLKTGTGHIMAGFGQGLNKNRLGQGYRYDMEINRYLTQFSVIFGGEFLKIGMGARFHLLDFRKPRASYEGTDDFDPDFIATNYPYIVEETRMLSERGLSAYLDLGGLAVYSFDNCNLGLQGSVVGAGDRDAVFSSVILGLHFSVNIDQTVRDKFKRVKPARGN